MYGGDILNRFEYHSKSGQNTKKRYVCEQDKQKSLGSMLLVGNSAGAQIPDGYA
jgi:hypothetical protein